MKEAVPEQNLLIQSWLGGRRGSAAGESDGVVEGLLFATAADGDPEELVAAFDRLAAWVDNSLDIYKVHCCWGVGVGGGRVQALLAKCCSILLQARGPWCSLVLPGPTAWHLSLPACGWLRSHARPGPAAPRSCSRSCRACSSPRLRTRTSTWWPWAPRQRHRR